MHFEKIERAIKDLGRGIPESFRDLCAEDVKVESMHNSSVGSNVKNRAETYEMHKGVPEGSIEVRCLVDTTEMCLVWHSFPQDDTIAYMCAYHFNSNGHIAACYYAKTSR